MMAASRPLLLRMIAVVAIGCWVEMLLRSLPPTDVAPGYLVLVASVGLAGLVATAGLLQMRRWGFALGLIAVIAACASQASQGRRVWPYAALAVAWLVTLRWWTDLR